MHHFSVRNGSFSRPRRLAVAAAHALVVAAALPVAACGQTLRISQPAVVSQTIGSTVITVRYNRPTARGRDLFGALVKWDEVWHPGADSATTFEVSREITIGGSVLPAGRYSLWTIPRASEWTLIFSSAADVFHQPYPEGKDVLRVNAAPKRGTHMESMAFYFPFANRTQSALVLHWGETVVEFPIETR